MFLYALWHVCAETTLVTVAVTAIDSVHDLCSFLQCQVVPVAFFLPFSTGTVAARTVSHDRHAVRCVSEQADINDHCRGD
jgi:hypothetical protein